MNYLIHLLVLIEIYLILGISLNLVLGYCGLLSLCHAAFFGIGAYASTLLTKYADWFFLPSVAAGMAISALLSLAISIPSRKLKGDYFVLSTIGFQAIVFAVLNNWVSLTEGPYGIPGIDRPSVGEFTTDSPLNFLVFSTLVAAIVGLLFFQIIRSPYGRTLRTIREDELAAISLGKKTLQIKVAVFAVSAALASIAGTLYAVYISYISPTDFDLEQSIFILSVVVIGGAGNLKGPFAGALFAVLLPEVLRFVDLPDATAGAIRQVIYGLALILFMRIHPSGICGAYDFD